MKIVVVGASGLIGTKTVDRLRRQGHEVVPASRKSGVNTVTGEGLKDALNGADVVVDVSNAPSWEDNAVMEFFETSTRNLLAAAQSAAIKHYVSLGVVGTERLLDSGYFRAKQAQEKQIQSGSTPYTIVHATQFFEFVDGLAQAATVGNTAHLSTALMQPIASDDVADVMSQTCTHSPANGIVEIAGPERLRQCDLVEKFFKATGDRRQIQAAPDALYYGVKIDDQSLCPGPEGQKCPTSFDQWLKSNLPAKA